MKGYGQELRAMLTKHSTLALRLPGPLKVIRVLFIYESSSENVIHFIAFIGSGSRCIGIIQSEHLLIMTVSMGSAKDLTLTSLNCAILDLIKYVTINPFVDCKNSISTYIMNSEHTSSQFYCYNF